jgi:hypothetical protein
MNKLTVGLIIAALSSSVFAQQAEVAVTAKAAAGGAAKGAGVAAGTFGVNNARNVITGLVAAGVAAAANGRDHLPTTSHH